MCNFWHEINEGDIIIARKGRKIIASIGKVTKTAFYNESMGNERIGSTPNYAYSNFIGVEWDNNVKEIRFPSIVFSLQTIYEISSDKFNYLIKGELPSEKEEEGVVEETEFVMEKYLEEFIISNFKKIFGDKLELYIDDEDNPGRQYPTEIGTIDILVKDKKTNDLVVIELKKGRESDKVVGQILRYMGWVNDNLAKDTQKVKGIIICKEQDNKMMYALKMTKDISVKYYTIDFKLSD